MTKVKDQDYEMWAREIASGGAVVFFGAGFSAGAIGFDGELPLGNQLRDKLGEFCGLKRKYYEKQDLKDVAEYCLNKQDRQKIVEKLKDIFRVKQSKDEQKAVVRWPWKSIYTTNYDDLVCYVGKQIDKNIDTLTLESVLPSESRNFCLHINGCVDRLEPKHLDNSFKLSRSSYVNSDVFANSPKWKEKFMNDLQYSALVVFMGYSLADMPIERILLAKTESMRNKTIFVVADPKNSNDDPIGDNKFEGYGKLLKIGMESFANKIQECWPQNTNLGFNYLEKITTSELLDVNVRDNDLKLFFEQGKFKDEWLQNEVLQYLKNGHQIRKSFSGKGFTLGDKITEGVKDKYSLKSPIQSDYVPKLIPRKEKIDEAKRELARDSVGILGVFGELGSGKTIFLRQLAIALVESGNSVYFVRHGDFISQKEEIDTLLKRLKDGNEKAIIFIDSYLNQLKIAQYIAKKVKETRCVKLILATRAVDWHGDESYKSISEDSSVEIGQLSDLDLGIFAQIISHLGLWSRSLSEKTFKEQKKHLQINCNAQMLLILLDIFNSKHIYNKLVESLNNVLSNKQIKKILFVICFLHVANITSKDIVLFSYLLGDDGLGNLKSQHVKQLRALNLWIDDDSGSSILALFILRYMFSYDEITGYAFEILKRVRNTEKSYHNLGYQAYLKLLNYRTMSRVFGKEKDGDKDKKFTFLRNYYDDAKREIPILIENPQFWLQYAICHISIGKFKEAQNYLDQAYGKANQKDSYDVDYIDNQQARLYIYQGIETEDKEDAFSFFKKAVELLGERRKEDEYKYSIIESFWEFLEKHFLHFGKNKQEVIQKVLANHHEKFCSFCGQGSWYKQKIIRGCEKVFEKYLPNSEKPNLSKNLSSK
ncbi:SIR2 family protein [Helicobacter pylori]|uniref:P-loop NTPase n=1 Tax=Helicobacter pylori TaxID=210 RepID=UPI000386AC21|nr:SIR2 family protein [Helicobacter pylori]EPZ73726.1 ATPase [Helicobacter pylori UM084]